MTGILRCGYTQSWAMWFKCCDLHEYPMVFAAGRFERRGKDILSLLQQNSRQDPRNFAFLSMRLDYYPGPLNKHH